MSAKVCQECGREGARDFTTTDAGVVRCSNREACLSRQLAEAKRQARGRGKRRLPRIKQHRETEDVASAVSRLVRAVGRRVAEEDLDGLAPLLDLDAALADAWADAVKGLRRNYADRLIGERIIDRRTGKGITRQAVEQRWPITAEERQALRDSVR